MHQYMAPERALSDQSCDSIAIKMKVSGFHSAGKFKWDN